MLQSDWGLLAGSILKRIPFFTSAHNNKQCLVCDAALCYVMEEVKGSVDKGQEVGTQLALQLHQFSPLLTNDTRWRQRASW